MLALTLQFLAFVGTTLATLVLEALFALAWKSARRALKLRRNRPAEGSFRPTSKSHDAPPASSGSVPVVIGLTQDQIEKYLHDEGHPKNPAVRTDQQSTSSDTDDPIATAFLMLLGASLVLVALLLTTSYLIAVLLGLVAGSALFQLWTMSHARHAGVPRMKAEKVALVGFILLSIVSGWVLYHLIAEERAGASWFEASKVVTLGFTDGWGENQGKAGSVERLLSGVGGAISSLAAAYGGSPLLFLFSVAGGIALWSCLLVYHYGVLIGLRRLHYFSLWQSSDWRVQKKVFSTVDKVWAPIFLYVIFGGLAVALTHGLLYDFYLMTT